MAWQLSGYHLLFFLAAAISLGVTLYTYLTVWPDRRTATTLWFMVFTAATAEWATAAGAQLMATTVARKLFVLRLFDIGSMVAPVAWLLFALAYTGRERLLTRRNVAALYVFPAVMFLLLVSNPVHHLVYEAPRLGTRAGLVVLERTMGPVFYVYVLYAYGAILTGVGLLLRKIVAVKTLYTGQIAALVFAVLAPVVVNVVYVTEIVVIPNLTSPTFAASALALGVAMKHYRLLDVVPVARATVFEEMRDGYVVVDEQQRVLDSNPAARRLLDAPDDVVGRPISDLLPDTFRGFPDPESADDFQQEFVRDHDGERLVVELAVTPLYRDAFVGWILTLRDSTARKERERELREKTERLDEFASLVSHDLRNPLSVADGYAELLEAEVDDDHRDMLTPIRDAHRRMDAMIDDVLARAREGGDVETTGDVSLQEIAKTAWSNVDTESAALEVADDVTLIANEDRLLHLFENLYRNAVEHGGSDVTVRVGALDGEGFYVADDGPGIPEADRETVFESGYSTQSGGTGLGLAIVDDIASAHGWSVSVTTAADAPETYDSAPSVAESASPGARFGFTGVETR